VRRCLPEQDEANRKVSAAADICANSHGPSTAHADATQYAIQFCISDIGTLIDPFDTSFRPSKAACRCLPEQHEENRKVRTIVHTAVDPALHMLTPHNVRFRDKFHAVDEAKRPVKESFSTPE